MCDMYRPSAIIGHVLYSYPTTSQYLHMTNVCRIYQSWERDIINTDILPLVVVIAVILYPSDSHSILRCWMTFIKTQFSKHRVCVCVCVCVCVLVSIMYQQRMPTIHVRVPAVCSCVSYSLTSSECHPAFLLDWLRPGLTVHNTGP